MDFIIWLLFSREKARSSQPQHLLCDGFRKRAGQPAAPCSIDGLYTLYFNERVANIKTTPWPQLLHLLGKSGVSMMINLLLDCSIFLPVAAGQQNYYQLSGKKFHVKGDSDAFLKSKQVHQSLSARRSRLAMLLMLSRDRLRSRGSQPI